MISAAYQYFVSVKGIVCIFGCHELVVMEAGGILELKLDGTTVEIDSLVSHVATRPFISSDIGYG